MKTTGEVIEKNKKTLKGVSKVVVKKEIGHKDYQEVLNDNIPKARIVTSFRSFKHEVYTYRESKVALTSFYDKMVMTDSINCHPSGYIKNN